MHPFGVDPQQLDEDPPTQQASDRGRRRLPEARRASGTGWALLVLLLVLVAVLAVLLLT